MKITAQIGEFEIEGIISDIHTGDLADEHPVEIFLKNVSCKDIELGDWILIGLSLEELAKLPQLKIAHRFSLEQIKEVRKSNSGSLP